MVTLRLGHASLPPPSLPTHSVRFLYFLSVRMGVRLRERSQRGDGIARGARASLAFYISLYTLLLPCPTRLFFSFLLGVLCMTSAQRCTHPTARTLRSLIDLLCTSSESLCVRLSWAAALVSSVKCVRMRALPIVRSEVYYHTNPKPNPRHHRRHR